MVLDKKESVIAYRCPKCGQNISSMVGVFSLSGDMIKLKCVCKNSELNMTYTNDNKIKITVPCLFCGTDHTFNVSKEAFFDKEIMTLNCPYAGLGIAFMGKKDTVSDEMKKSDEELIKLLGEYDPSDLIKANEKNDAEPFDAQVHDIVNFMLSELEADDKIRCRCDKKGDYRFSFDKEGVTIFCKECGAKKHFDLDSVSGANDFLGTDVLVLE